MTDDAHAPEDSRRAADEPGSESMFGVLGTSLSLFCLAGLLAGLIGLGFLSRGLPVDGPAKVRETFIDGNVPFGLELLEQARLPSREVILRFGLAVHDEPGGDSTGEGEAGRTDPEELVLIEFPERDAALDVFLDRNTPGGFMDRREAARKLKEWTEDPKFAWRTTLKGDDVEWGRWRTRYRIVRSFREGGGWRDSVRLDISRPDKHRVLFAQYPPGVEPKVDDARELARTIAM